MKRIVLTGGGTAGHVTPNMALIPALKAAGYDIQYVGSHDGMERKLIEDMGIPYHGISSGKLRRYLSKRNISDAFRVLKGMKEAKQLLKELKPDVVFSKGGYVTVPVVMAAGRAKIPAIIHESDMTPGLANKLAIPYATKVCCNFPEAMENLPKEKAVLTGTPIRQELFSGDADAGLEFCGFNKEKPVLLVIGGSSGSVVINNAVRDSLEELTKKYQIIHLCGAENLAPSLEGTKGYVQFEYIKKELANLFACADFVISRAGANAICELLALQKPNILIPLSKAASRGDQILNAASFKKQGFSYVIEEEELTKESLLLAVEQVYSQKEEYIKNMSSFEASDSIATIMKLIEDAVLLERCK